MARATRSTAEALILAICMHATVWAAPTESGPPSGYRSPTDVAVSADGRWLVTANAASLSLVDLATGTVADEVVIGARPIAIVYRDDSRFVAITAEAGDLVLLDVAANRIRETGRLHLGFEPRSIALSPEATTGYVSLSSTGRLAVVDLGSLRLVETIELGTSPTWVAVAPDGCTVAVACTGRPELVLVDATSRTVRARHPFKGLNLGQIAFMPDGRSLHFTFTYDGGSHPSPGNIRRGWVTGSRLGRLRLAEPVGLDGLTLDVPGRAVGDVLGVALVDAGAGLVVTAGGTHELLRFDAGQLPWRQISGSEVMDRALAGDPERFRRLEVGGRPLGIRGSPDGRRLYVANALLDAVQEVDAATFTLLRTIQIDRSHQPSPAESLARRGEAIFYDAHRSLDHWYSCHTCHYEGGGNTVTFDTLNDGSSGSYKTVLPLWGVAETGPWTWHGWQTDLATSLRKSLVDSMQGPPPSDDDVTALAAFLAKLTPPPSPFREADGGLSPTAARGRELFASARAGCTNCHTGPYYTSPDLHDVGLIRSGDRYPGFSPPTLAGGFRKTMFLHHGKAKSLHQLLTGLHAPDKVSDLPPLSEPEVEDLVAYLKSL